ncbi:MAG: NupC/NupG family nucleoside CNT transporter [Bdellovibrionaceae bacterium]|nr:NupC/NupG family nucleoside CNT transporter [Pseudobdellovibrionaceae bacterium]MDW8189415.1 NupC/NupG family nucleoside CNT transporter [Pseudobdellovibrionaceae bacterium]
MVFEKVIAFFGFLIFLLLAWVLSDNKKAIPWRTVFWGVGLQIFLGVVILKTDHGLLVFQKLGDWTRFLLNFSLEGSRFIFGKLADPEGSWGFLFVTMVLPTIIFMSSLMSVLYFLGIMPKIVQAFAWVMVKTMRISGPESLAAASNIFVGQTEAPLVIRPYLEKMTRSEIMSLMTGGMATVAGGVLVAYVGFGVDPVHLLAASVISAPAALTVAKLMVPPEPRLPIDFSMRIGRDDTSNILEAATQGATEGLRLAANVAAMLVAFISLIALLNHLLGALGGWIGWPSLSLDLILAYVNAPFAWLMGVPSQDVFQVGVLLGKKIVFNEFVGYMDLVKIAPNLDQRSVIVATYALCGFANFSSIAIQIGGIGALAPTQKKTLVQLGLRSLVGGTLACYLTACVAGFLV